jgi:hypothetical protein
MKELGSARKSLKIFWMISWRKIRSLKNFLVIFKDSSGNCERKKKKKKRKIKNKSAL